MTQENTVNNTYKPDEAFSRNLGILKEQEQEVLLNSCVVIAGLGGIGGHVALTLARMGIGHFRLADFDRFESSNLNRQSGASVSTIGRPKCEVVAAQIREINPAAKIEVFPEGFQVESASALLEGADIAVDAIDFYEIETHIQFHRQARAHGLFVLMGSPVGFSGCLQIYDPEGMSFEEYCDITDDMPALEKQIRYASGVVPGLAHLDYYDVSSPDSGTDFMARKGPSIASAISLAGAMVCTELAIILLDRRKPLSIPYTHQFDPYTFRYYKTYTEGGMKNYDPKPALNKIKNRTTLISQVLNVLYAKPQAEPAKVNDIEIYYRIDGEDGKPCLVLINPLGVDSTFWDFVVEILAKDYKVITYDHRGTGESTIDDKEVSTEVLASDLVALLEHLGVHRATLVGMALGGCVAQLVAATDPDLVERLILVSTYDKSDSTIREVTQEWRDIATDHGLEVLFDRCLEWLFPDTYISLNKAELDQLRLFMKLTQQDPEVFRRLSLAGVEHDSSALLSNIQQKTLIIHGVDDRLVDLGHGETLAEHIRNAQFMPLEGCTHFLTWNNADQFCEKIDRFMKSA